MGNKYFCASHWSYSFSNNTFFFRDGTFREIKSTNKLYLLGGILGVVITFTVMLSMKSLGVTIGTAVILIVAQISASALIDAFGLFGTEKVPFSLHEILGIAIMIAGIVLLNGSFKFIILTKGS